mmetsp:Transcript_25241/g.64148  ORF Transcript_25241/g.64148 Transcript_25241/m.64148 type:complete len:297 (-) Transcript_25241:762-1652(-)
MQRAPCCRCALAVQPHAPAPHPPLHVLLQHQLLMLSRLPPPAAAVAARLRVEAHRHLAAAAATPPAAPHLLLKSGQQGGPWTPRRTLHPARCWLLLPARCAPGWEAHPPHLAAKHPPPPHQPLTLHPAHPAHPLCSPAQQRARGRGPWTTASRAHPPQGRAQAALHRELPACAWASAAGAPHGRASLACSSSWRPAAAPARCAPAACTSSAGRAGWAAPAQTRELRTQARWVLTACAASGRYRRTQSARGLSQQRWRSGGRCARAWGCRGWGARTARGAWRGPPPCSAGPTTRAWR